MAPLIFVAILFLLAPARAGAAEDFGSLVVSREHATWPDPDSVVRDLRSENDDVRFKALLSIGVSEKLARDRTPEQVELRYAALGSAKTQQAIVAAQVGGVYAFAAVATPKGNGWERVALFSCWCKYEQAVLDAFLSVKYGLSGGDELVLRASGGGTGLYVQNEVHFRLHAGEMKAVIAFVSRLRDGTPERPRLRLEWRQFTSLPVNLPGGGADFIPVLVEGTGDAAHSRYPHLPEVDDRYTDHITCRTFRWNPDAFEYQPASGPNPCKPPDSSGGGGR